MQSITRTHNAYHLGDNLVHLHFLRKVAQTNPDRQFLHCAQWQYLPQLRDVIQDIPNITLSDFNYLLPTSSINAWRGADEFWYQHPLRNDFVRFHIEAWFPKLCSKMEVENPMRTAKDMLFDYPAIKRPIAEKFDPVCDVLVINSAPGSGQFQQYNAWELGRLAGRISEKMFDVVTTSPVPAGFSSVRCTENVNLTVTQIGHLSLHCHAILMVSTGPSWPTFNIWNYDTVMNRIILLEPERVNLAPHTVHCSRTEEAEEKLKNCGLL